MTIWSTAVSVVSTGTTIFAPSTDYFDQTVYVGVNTGTIYVGGGTSLATGGGTSGGIPLTPASDKDPWHLGATDRLYAITASGTADVRVLLFTPSR